MPIPNSQRIIQQREERGWTQPELARRAELDPKTIWNAEKGVSISRASITAIAQALGVPAAELQVAPVITPEPDETRRSVLIVDDAPQMRDLLTRILAREYDVTTVDSAAAAEAVFGRRSVDIILTDKRMGLPPKRSGIQLLEWVRFHSPRTIRLLMTGYSELEDTIAAINRGHVYHYLSKPLPSIDEVLHVFRQAAEKFELVRSRDQLLEQLQQANRDLERRVAERTVELEKAYCELQQRAVEMERLALTDPLTKLFNRRAVEALALTELKRHTRYQNALALGIVDIDDFREINRRYLLPGGDAVLVGLAKLLTTTMRETDSVGRIAGEKFLVIARETNQDGAAALAERVRARVEGTPIDYQGQKVALTVSSGFAVVEGATLASYAQMYELAKAALDEAKSQGRNRCVVRRIQG
jgi:diguanylate cyclase (GGDEF)-like protein